MKRWNRLDGLIIGLFAALVVLFYWRILTPNLADRQSFPPGDFHAQFWAFATHESRELSAGRLPLWNPYTFAGAPFWADVQAAVFYPPSLLTLLLSAPWGFSLFALELEAIAHFWLAASFMFLFCRDLTGSRAAAVIAALTFTFSGYLTGYPSQQLAVLEADIWLPLILFCLHRATTPPSISHPWLILAGVAWAMALLAGHPQSAFIIACLSASYLIFRISSQNIGVRDQGLGSRNPPVASEAEEQKPGPTQHTIRNIYYALRFTTLFLLTGLALAAVQFIPAVEYTLLSVRAAGTYEVMSGGFPLADIIQLLLPGQVSQYSPLYVGVIGLILAISVIFATPNRQTLFWGGVVFISLLISFGGHTFLYSPLYLFVPGFSIFRGQERWAFATAFSLSVLTAYAFRELTNQASSSHPDTQHTLRNTHHVLRFTSYVSRLTHALLLFAILLLFLFFYGLNDTGWSPQSPFYGLLSAATLLSLLSFLAWLLWKFAARLQPLPFTVLTASLICLDLFSVNWQTNLYPQPPEWHTQAPALAQAIKADAATAPGEPYRVYNEFRLYDNYGVPFQIEDLWGASPLRPARYDELLAPPMPIERTWQLLNVKYVITWRQELFVPSTIIYQEPAADGMTYLHRLEQVGPRAWLVYEAEMAGDAAILQKIAGPNFNPWQMALLEPGAAATPGLAHLLPGYETAVSTASVTSGTVRLTFPSPQALSIQVETAEPGLLILSEPDYPGWRAIIDGQPAPLLRANYALRAVPIPAGAHEVTLAFRPLSFTLGAGISLLALGVVLLVFISAWRRGHTR